MSRKILVADESDAIRSVAVNVFRLKGHEVLTASGGAEAWEILKSGKIDLAILNSSLSGMDGYTLSRLIKEDGSLGKTRSILMLSPSEIVNQHQLVTAQADGTLNKPFSPPDLLSKAGEILGEEFIPSAAPKVNDLDASVSEMDMTETQIAEEIDFESVFGDDNDKKSSGESEDVHFAEVISDSAARVEDSTEDLPVEEESSPVSSGSADDEIHLASDQYGLEEPFEPPEVEVPHDYNWFIREMKSEISNKPGAPKKAQPATAKPKAKKSSEETTGHFMVEEIGTTKIYPGEIDKKTESDDPLGKLLADGIESKESDNSEASVNGEGKLVLAEKILVKELARQLAEKIVSRIPRKELHTLLNDLFSELKKY